MTDTSIPEAVLTRYHLLREQYQAATAEMNQAQDKLAAYGRYPYWMFEAPRERCRRVMELSERLAMRRDDDIRALERAYPGLREVAKPETI